MIKDVLRWLAVIIFGVALILIGFIGRSYFADYAEISQNFTAIMGVGLLVSILCILTGAVNIFAAFLILVSLWLLSISAAIRSRGKGGFS